MIWVLLDLSYILHRAQHSVGTLEYGSDKTGVIFGFFQQLRTACQHERVRSNKVAIFADSRTSFRKQFFSTYKKKRLAKTPEQLELKKQVWEAADTLTKEILPEVGLAVHRQVGLESDDLIAKAAAGLSVEAAWRADKSRQAVIVSSDGDLFQCITRSVHWFDPMRNKYFDPKGFRRDRGIHARKWGDVKALAGCKSDDVPGIHRVGEKTAIRYLLASLPPTTAAYRAIASQEGQAVLRRNKHLVQLPHTETQAVDLHRPDYKSDAFFRVCERLGFKSILAERESWEVFFRGTHFAAPRSVSVEVRSRA